eukprot:GFUD01013231.1.p1 GENE.GFUD01013231.1~~GFUD01013231.1.p1  ORF type:complete len:473 (+),score=82.72 GFUD01013231.1:152-1570(+)
MFAFMKEVQARGVACVLGGFILCLSFASDFSYPNINTYLISYMRSTGYNPDLTYADFIFLSSTKTLLQGVSMPFIGALARKIGTRPSVAIGSSLYSIGFAATYFTSQLWFPLAILTLSCHGIAFSFAYATAIGAAQKWFSPENKGLVGSLVVSGYGFGSLFWVPIQTFFVNPENIKAEIDPNCSYVDKDHEERCDFYFVDKDLLEKVPWMFVLLGGIYVVMGILAVILISDPPEDSANFTLIDQEVVERETCTNDLEWKKVGSLSPQEVLKTSIFYKIWFGFFSISLTNGLMGNYSKTFGLTFIQDDHYFAKVAVFLNILNGSSRVVWGLAYDRLGFKQCFMIIGVIVTLITSTLPVLPMIGSNTLTVKIAYGCWMCLLYSVFPGIFAIVAAGVADAFGPDHYQSNFGLLFSQSIAYCATVIILTKVPVIHAVLGYNGMFLVAGGCGVLGLVVVAQAPRQLSSSNSNEGRLF